MSNTSIKTRRLFITDQHWNRTSPSWKQLKPRINFNCFDENDESISDYCCRIKNIIDVPEEVAEQWLCPLYYNGHTVSNYGWINYQNSIFESATITTEQANNLSVIKEYSSYVQLRRACVPFEGFACIDRDKEHWAQERTWRVPPIIVDVQSFPSPPPYADFSWNYQLVEGHTRLGYLKSMYRTGEKLRKQHSVYILKSKQPPK